MNDHDKTSDNTKPEENKFVENIIPANEASNNFKLLKILIAEDDEISALFLTTVIKKLSREVLYAETGVEAIEVCRNNPDIDLVLMDIKMPVLNGYEATKQIRNFNKVVIIFAQTAQALTGDREKAIMAGCNDYISKPILSDKLQALIQKYFK